MSTKPKSRDRRGRRRGGSRRSESNRIPDRPSPPCTLCGQPIQDITSALSDRADGNPVHFDCALKVAAEELKPTEKELVVYMGKGSFAAVDQESYQQRKLKINRTIEWERRDEAAEWRTALRTEVN